MSFDSEDSSEQAAAAAATIAAVPAHEYAVFHLPAAPRTINVLLDASPDRRWPSSAALGVGKHGDAGQLPVCVVPVKLGSDGDTKKQKPSKVKVAGVPYQLVRVKQHGVDILFASTIHKVHPP